LHKENKKYLFTGRNAIEKCKRNIAQSSMKINKNCKRKIWKPSKFILSKNSRVATTYEQINSIK